MFINPSLAGRSEAGNAPGAVARPSSGASFAGILAQQTAPAGGAAIPAAARQLNESARMVDPAITERLAQLKSAIIAGGTSPGFLLAAAGSDSTAPPPQENAVSLDPALTDKILQLKNAIIAGGGFATAGTGAAQSNSAIPANGTAKVNSEVPWGTAGSVTPPANNVNDANGPAPAVNTQSLNESNALWGVAQWEPGTEPEVAANEWYNPGWFWEYPGDGSGPLYVQRTNAYGGYMQDDKVQWVAANGAVQQGIPATGSWNDQTLNQLV